MFCYFDVIGEANRVYGGMSWLRYDEQFKQRKAVRLAIRWDHKDIGLWIKLITLARSGSQFFSRRGWRNFHLRFVGHQKKGGLLVI